MSTTARFDILLALLTLLFGVTTTLVTLLWKWSSRWTHSQDRTERLEEKFSDIATDIKELVEHKERVHAEIMAVQKADRDATNIRLRYLEEWHMKRGDRG